MIKELKSTDVGCYHEDEKQAATSNLYPYKHLLTLLGGIVPPLFYTERKMHS